MSRLKDHIKKLEDFIKMKKQLKEALGRNIKLQKKCVQVARQEMFIQNKKIEMAKNIIKIDMEDIRVREAAAVRDSMAIGEAVAEIKSVQHILDRAKKDLKEEKKIDRKIKKNWKEHKV